MTLIVEDPEAYRLAQHISSVTGVSVSEAVTEALREVSLRLGGPKRKATADELMALAARVSENVTGPAPDHGKLLYDDHGLPK